MPTIVESDLKLWLSVNDGPGNSAPQANPNLSLGGYVASTPFLPGQVHSLFDAVTAEQNVAEQVDYRVFFVHNAHATLTWKSVKVWIAEEVAGGCDVAIALDGTGPSVLDSSDPQAEVLTDEFTPPSGESFSSPTSEGEALAVGDLAPGEVQAVWVRRTATNSLSKFGDGATLRIEGTTVEA